MTFPFQPVIFFLSCVRFSGRAAPGPDRNPLEDMHRGLISATCSWPAAVAALHCMPKHVRKSMRPHRLRTLVAARVFNPRAAARLMATMHV
jgi:hypothetical protein